MGNRCDSCCRFVSLELDEPDLDLYMEGITVMGDVHLVLLCVECGQGMKEAVIDLSLDVSHACDEGAGEEPDFEIANWGSHPFDRYQKKDRHGKPIEKVRYMKHFYGAEIEVTIRCPHCEGGIFIKTRIEEQASSFEELQ